MRQTDSYSTSNLQLAPSFLNNRYRRFRLKTKQNKTKTNKTNRDDECQPRDLASETQAKKRRILTAADILTNFTTRRSSGQYYFYGRRTANVAQLCRIRSWCKSLHRATHAATNKTILHCVNHSQRKLISVHFSNLLAKPRREPTQTREVHPRPSNGGTVLARLTYRILHLEGP